MPPAGQPKFKRRKADRPKEIVAAAMEIFAEKGFAAARLDDIAARAGVSKGALYLYFATKEDLFRAVIEQGVAPNLGRLQAALVEHRGAFPELLRAFAAIAVGIATETPVGGIAKMVIGESRNFPELARAWRERLVEPALGAMSGAIAAAQARGELRAGDPRHAAISLVSPMLLGVIWRETFVPVGAEPFDLRALLAQHVDTILGGMALPGAAA